MAIEDTKSVVLETNLFINLLFLVSSSYAKQGRTAERIPDEYGNISFPAKETNSLIHVTAINCTHIQIEYYFVFVLCIF